MQKNIQSGFTLIELIIVIVILGILSVVAAPKFIDISTDAQLATIEAESATFRSAVKLVHSVYMIRQTTPVDVAGATVTIDTSSGFPTGRGSGAQFCVNLWNDLLANPEPVNGISNLNATLEDGWSAFGNANMCAYGKHFDDRTFASGDLPHFVYYINDVNSVNYNGQTYGGNAGTVQLFNI